MAKGEEKEVMFDFFALDPEKTVKKAEELQNEGRVDKALSLILKALKSHPENPLLNLKAFEYHLYANKERDSFVYFQKALKSKKVKKDAEKILLENLSRIGLEKHREHYFENLIEEFKVKEAKEFFKNLDRKEIEKLRERYKKFVDEIYKREIERPTRGLLRGLLILSIIEWEYGNYENSREALKDSFRLFPDAREQIIEIIEEETKFGKNRLFASFIIGELFYLFEKEDRGVAILENVLTRDETYFEAIKEIFSEKIPETKKGKRFYAEILIKDKNYENLIPFLEGLERKELISLLDKIDVENAVSEPEIARNLLEYFKRAGLRNKIIDIFYLVSKNLPGKISEFLEDAKNVIEVEFNDEYLRKFVEAIKNIKGTGEILIEIYNKNPDIINNPEFSSVLNEVIEEIPDDRNLLEIFALSLLKSGRFEEALDTVHYILSKSEEIINEDIVQFIEENKEVLLYYPSFYEILYELHLSREGKTEEVLLEYFRKFPDLKNRIIVFLDDLGERKKDFIEKIIDDIRYVQEKEELPDGIIEFLKAELCLKKEYYKEAEDYYYKAFKTGVKWVRKRVKELEEEGIDSPHIKLLKGKILIDDGKIEEGAGVMISALRNSPELLKNVATFLRNKMSKEKNIYLSIPYLEILIMQKYYEPALNFAKKILNVKDRRLKGEILSMYSQALWKSGKIKDAQESIKKLLAERYKFDPVPLIRFFEEEIKEGKKTPFVYQTLGTLYLLNQKPSQAAMCYFNLAFLNPKLSQKIKNMLVSIEAQFPEDPGIKCAKAGIEIVSGNEIEGYEEVENVVETEKSILELEPFLDFIYKKDEPYPLFLRSLIAFHKGEENYIEHIKKINVESMPDYLKHKIENLLQRGIEKRFSVWDSMIMLFDIYMAKNKKERIFEYVKKMGLPEDKEKIIKFRKFFIALQEDYKEDKAYNFYLGTLLLRLSDSRGFFFLEKSLPKFLDKIYEKFEEFKTYEKCEKVLLKVVSEKGDIQKFKEIFLKLPEEFILEEYDLLHSLINNLPYDREIYYRVFDILIKKKDNRISELYNSFMKLETDVAEKINLYLNVSNNIENVDRKSFYNTLLENSDRKQVVQLWDRIYREFMKERFEPEEKDILNLADIYEKEGKVIQAFELLENYRKRQKADVRVLKKLKYLRKKLFKNSLLLKLEV